MENQAPDKHICGLCHDEWLTEDEYNNHVCPSSGQPANTIEHLVATTTPDFEAISQAALERGAQDAQEATPEQPIGLG